MSFKIGLEKWLRERLGVFESEVPCCDSCHEEMNDGDDDHTIVIDGSAYWCCCRLKRHIKEVLYKRDEYRPICDAHDPVIVSRVVKWRKGGAHKESEWPFPRNASDKDYKYYYKSGNEINGKIVYFNWHIITWYCDPDDLSPPPFTPHEETHEKDRRDQ